MLKLELRTIEQIMLFDEYLSDCIEYFRLQHSEAKKDKNVTAEPTIDSNQKRNSVSNDVPEESNREVITQHSSSGLIGGLPENYIDILGDIQQAVFSIKEKLTTGLNSPEELFSTSSAHYNN